MLKVLSRIPKFHSVIVKNIHTSVVCRLREITVEKPNENTTVIDCKYVKSPREPYLIKLDRKNSKCPLCQLKLNLKYTDVLILCQYLDSEGRILRFKDTDLCQEQYKLVTELVSMAQYAGLLPEPPREEPKKPYNLLNTYYDEKTINVRPKRSKRYIRFYKLKDKLSPTERFRIKPEIGPYYGPKV